VGDYRDEITPLAVFGDQLDHGAADESRIGQQADMRKMSMDNFLAVTSSSPPPL
jgi:hypothetical protein